MKRALGVLAILLCAIGVYLAISTRRSEVDVESRPRSSLKERDTELEPLPELASGSLRSQQTNPDPSAAPATSATPTDSAAFDVRVIVLSRKERQPIADLAVKITWWQAEKDGPSAEATTDATGSVALRLETGGVAREHLCNVNVGAGENLRRFTALPLQSELVLLIDSCTRLHGLVVVSGAEMTEPAWVSAFEPASGMMSTHTMFARTRAQVDGSFEMQACPSREIPWVDMNIGVGTVNVTRSIAWAELSSEAGARIEIQVCELTVRVLDEAGAPLAKADVRVSRLVEDAPFPACGVSNERGEFRTSLEPADCEIIVGSAGRASAIERVVLTATDCPRIVELRLRSLRESDHLRGRVVLEDRIPVEGAIVTAIPVANSSEGAVAAHAQMRTDANGRFDLAMATDRELEVVAFRRDVGYSDEVRFTPDGRELELVIRAQGSLEVRIALPPGFSGFAQGHVEYVLVDRRFDLVDHGHEFEVPFTLSEIPAGDYNLFVYVAGWNAYAEGSVHVAAGDNRSDSPAWVELSSHPAQFARGQVLTANGSPTLGAHIEVDHPTWPPEVERLWSVKVGDGGRFEALLGVDTACSARVTLAGQPVQRVELHEGDGAILRLP
ncbi:MAG TPA: carboxypeptidase regulatory-like domain-containing protein [Planctomycetota bacterium]|nr:carboxypeptidase regulatory-like domain-containing protein [Planctomycetota bacterium]